MRPTRPPREFHAFIEALADHHGSLTLKRSLRAEPCWSLLVVNAERHCGGVLCGRPTGPANRRSRRKRGSFGIVAVRYFDLLFALADEAGIERRRLAAAGVRRWSSILLLERLDFSLAFLRLSEGRRSCTRPRITTTDFVPEHGDTW